MLDAPRRAQVLAMNSWIPFPVGRAVAFKKMISRLEAVFDRRSFQSQFIGGQRPPLNEVYLSEILLRGWSIIEAAQPRAVRASIQIVYDLLQWLLSSGLTRSANPYARRCRRAARTRGSGSPSGESCACRAGDGASARSSSRLRRRASDCRQFVAAP